MSVDFFELSKAERELLEAIQMNRHDWIEEALAKNVGLHFTASYADERPLHIAAKCARAETILFLVNKGANIEARDEQGQTPLFCAAGSGSHDALVQLLDLGADPNHVAHTQRTALFSAALNNHHSIVTTLLERGADPNIAANGSTALFYAVGSGHYEAARALVEGGARVDLRNAQGESIVDVAKRVGAHHRYDFLMTEFLAATQVRLDAVNGTPNPVAALKPLKFKTPAQ